MNGLNNLLFGENNNNRLSVKCDSNFKKASIFNPLSLFNDLQGLIKCDFNKGGKSLGNMDIKIVMEVTGPQVMMEASEGLMGELFKEAGVFDEILKLK